MRPREAKAPHTRCALCNEAGFLELRHEETDELLVHRCPHKLEMVKRIEEWPNAYRLADLSRERGGRSVV
jgi:hypothetical protein